MIAKVLSTKLSGIPIGRTGHVVSDLDTGYCVRIEVNSTHLFGGGDFTEVRDVYFDKSQIELLPDPEPAEETQSQPQPSIMDRPTIEVTAIIKTIGDKKTLTIPAPESEGMIVWRLDLLPQDLPPGVYKATFKALQLDEPNPVINAD